MSYGEFLLNLFPICEVLASKMQRIHLKGLLVRGAFLFRWIEGDKLFIFVSLQVLCFLL
jgi:hypothetical protein